MSAEGPPTFASPEAKHAFERQEAAREEVHPLDWEDSFGPLKYTELPKLVMHMQRIARAGDDAAEEHALAVSYGYRDASHFRSVRATFLKYWGAPGSNNVLRDFSWKEPEYSQAVTEAARLEREASAPSTSKDEASLHSAEAISIVIEDAHEAAPDSDLDWPSAPSNVTPLYERWSAFLEAVRKRIDEICAKTEGETRVLIAKDPTNPQALKNEQQALNQRVENIRTKIEAAWSANDLYHYAPTAGASLIPAPESAYEEWYATERYLSEAWTTCKVHCMAEFLRAMKPYVDDALAKPMVCTSCGQSLAPSVRHSPESITCAHCQTVNPYVPEPLVYAWFSDAPHNLGLEQVLPLRYAVLRAGEDVAHGIEAAYRKTGERPEELAESKQKREAMAREYYVAFAAAKARIKPSPVEEQAAEVQRAMVAFRQSL